MVMFILEHMNDRTYFVRSKDGQYIAEVNFFEAPDVHPRLDGDELTVKVNKRRHMHKKEENSNDD